MGVSVTLQDHSFVQIEDLSYNFFVNEADVNKSLALSMVERVQELNTFAKVSYELRSITELPDEYFSDFDVILVSGCSQVNFI